MNRRGDEIERLLQIIQVQSQIAAGDLDVESAMQLIADHACALSRSEGTLVALPEADELIFCAAAGTSAALGDRYPLRGSLGGLCLSERRVLISEDCEVDPRVDRATCRRIGARSLLCVPLIHGEEVLGVLTAMAPKPNHFDAGDVRALELIGDAASAHLHHARRFSREAHRSLHDSLTDLPNRRAYEERFPVEATRAARKEHPLSLCLLDLNGFKAVNDRYGHVAGDAVLRAVAAGLRRAPVPDCVFRIGGDEFAILLPGWTAEQAQAAVATLLEGIEGGSIAESEPGFGISFGIACEETDPILLHAAADRELVAAKNRLYTRE